jgi:hypothetical protein
MIFPSKVSSTEFIVIGNLSMDRYTVSGTTVTYTSNSKYSNTSVGGGELIRDNVNFIFSFNSAENLYTGFRDSYLDFSGTVNRNNFNVLKKQGNFYELCNSTTLEKSLNLGTVTGSAISRAIDMVELDTDIILLVTNNDGSTTITASILKYAGA